ncbi:hypothetical protein HHK36_027891 [Tetracentron sinense]|uniref:TPX2 central domain-containing protein n=1 Tax=Tetracentron sinense TaxID=13715 RepID=A0A834YHG4_TETSI|nr:hypothetical protein HHK36_027891 [Tetracentron sinense]
MDEEMEDTFEEGFLALEIDLDYEFDATRYFDFCRKESVLEAREAELWFESAGSYPPSPFIAKLNLREDILMVHVNTSPKPKDVENTDPIINDSDIGMGLGFLTSDENNRDNEGTSRGVLINLATSNLHKVQNEPQDLTTGLTFYNHMAQDTLKAKTKSSIKPSFWRKSTLMKPTASQLAKQNRPQEVGYSNQFLERFQKLSVQIERSLENPSGVESQAAKRQKLEGGHLCKVADMKQQINLVHKAPKKDGPCDSTAHAKLKLTIPREPDLETAHRAQRTRPKNSTELGGHVKSTAYTFKARPLNRKILEAPSLPLSQKSTPKLPQFQVFHLKTSERAMQNSSAASSSLLPRNKFDKVVHKPNTSSIKQNETTDSKRPNSMDVPKQEGCEIMHKYKARPLNKKIFSSKGDMGVFRNSKRETTVPLEFNFPTDKRFQNNPPIDIATKGSKENTLGSFQHENKMTHVVKEKTQRFGIKQIQCGNGGGITEVGPRANMKRYIKTESRELGHPLRVKRAKFLNGISCISFRVSAFPWRLMDSSALSQECGVLFLVSGHEIHGSLHLPENICLTGLPIGVV